MTSRLSKKYATDKQAELKGILYEVNDDQGPLFRCRLARVGGENKKHAEKLNELMKPYRRMKYEDVPEKKRDAINLELVCTTIVIPGTWQTYVPGEPLVDESGNETPTGKWENGIEDPSTGNLLPATTENYKKVLGELTELRETLMREAMNVDNYRADALEAEAKN